MKIIKHKVGRPIIYQTTNERLVVRKKQNRINQRRCRLRKQRMKEIQSSTQTNKKRNDDYINNILNFFGQYQYNYFFTGTYDPSIEERNERILRNKEINKNNNTFGLDIPFEIENKIGINSLRRYTEKYLQFLFNLNILNRSFVVFELGKNKKYHVHIMMNSKPDIVNFENITENSWLLGSSITEPIINTPDIWNYILKEFNTTSNQRTSVNIIDNWFFYGDYSNPIFASSKIEFEKYRINKLTV